MWKGKERYLFLGKSRDRLLLVLNSQHHDAYSDFKKTLQIVCCLLSFHALCLSSNHYPVINTAETQPESICTGGHITRSNRGVSTEGAQLAVQRVLGAAAQPRSWGSAAPAPALPSELTNLCFRTPTALDCTLCLTRAPRLLQASE